MATLTELYQAAAGEPDLLDRLQQADAAAGRIMLDASGGKDVGHCLSFRIDTAYSPFERIELTLRERGLMRDVTLQVHD